MCVGNSMIHKEMTQTTQASKDVAVVQQTEFIAYRCTWSIIRENYRYALLKLQKNELLCKDKISTCVYVKESTTHHK